MSKKIGELTKAHKKRNKEALKAAEKMSAIPFSAAQAVEQTERVMSWKK